MSDQFSMFEPTTSEGSPSVTSSPGSGSGVMPCDVPVGSTIDPSGPAVVPVQVSPLQVKAKGLQTLVTSGRHGSISSASAALEQSLVSRLMERLDTAGSTLFQQTWKRKATPLRRRYWAHTASARRTSDSGCTSLPTPAANEYEHRDQEALEKRRQECKDRTGNGNGFGLTLGNAAQLASVPTPNLGDHNNSRIPPEKAQAYSMKRLNRENACSQLADTVQALAALPTPNAMEGGQTSRGGKRKGEMLMGGIAKLAACPTPMAGTPAQKGYNEAGSTDYERQMDVALGLRETVNGRKVQLSPLHTPNCPRAHESENGAGRQYPSQRQKELQWDASMAQLAATGQTAIGGGEETGSGGQLNPAYSRWLMGLPAAWDDCAGTETRSSPRSRRRS